MKRPEIYCEHCGCEITSTFFVSNDALLCMDCFIEEEQDRIASKISEDPYGYDTYDADVYEPDEWYDEYAERMEEYYRDCM